MGAVSRAVDQYKNWPGRIEDYEPGRSSIAQNDNRVSHPQLSFHFYDFYFLLVFSKNIPSIQLKHSRVKKGTKLGRDKLNTGVRKVIK